MSYILESVNKKAIAAWNLDDDSPFSDYSGYSRSGTSSAQPARSVPLAKGCDFSSVFDSSTTGTFASPVFKSGQERNSFSLAAVVLPEVSEGEQKVLSNNSAYDGIILAPNKIIFRTSYQNSTTSECVYEYDFARKFFIVGVHTEEKNQLYIDGELVDESDITPEQNSSGYPTTNSNLYSGTTSGASRFSANGFCVYGQTLSSREIFELYSQVENSQLFETGTELYEELDLFENNMNAFLRQTWNNEENWKRGEFNNTVTSDDLLLPGVLEGVSQAGTWESVFPLDISDTTTTYGVIVDYEGYNAIVEVSLDGNTWEVADRKKMVSTVASGTTVANKVLGIRVSFAGGLVDDPAFLESLTVSGYRNGEVANSIARVVTLTAPASPMEAISPSYFDLSSGTNFEFGSALVGPSVSTPAVTYNSAELIMRVNQPNSDIRMFDARIGGNTEYWGFNLATNTTHRVDMNVYFNGTQVNSSAVPVVGRWYIVHLVSTAGGFDSFTLNRINTGGSTFSGDVTLARLRLYPSALTATQVTNIINNYRGKANILAADSNAVVVTEPASSTNIYTYDWSISAAG